MGDFIQNTMVTAPTQSCFKLAQCIHVWLIWLVDDWMINLWRPKTNLSPHQTVLWCSDLQKLETNHSCQHTQDDKISWDFLKKPHIRTCNVCLLELKNLSENWLRKHPSKPFQLRWMWLFQVGGWSQNKLSLTKKPRVSQSRKQIFWGYFYHIFSWKSTSKRGSNRSVLLETSISNWFKLYNRYLIVYLTYCIWFRSTAMHISNRLLSTRWDQNHWSYILVPVPKLLPVPKGVFVEDPNISKANEHNLS